MNKQKKIFVLYTGGTIGMIESGHGLIPDTAITRKILANHSDGLSFDWHVCDPLIDSSAVTPENWQSWLALLQKNIPNYDGILILHGTDTLAYTANILALTLRSLEKPIVLTGAQQPYGAPDSDAPFNLATAVAALNLALPQVSIAFNGKLFPAVGSSKISTEDPEGFNNPHFGISGSWLPENGWQHIRHRPSEKQQQGLALKLNPNVRIACYTFIPGLSKQLFSDGLNPNQADAAILQSYGHGNTPSYPELIQAVQQFTASGRPVLNISQVGKGNAARVYAQSNALLQAGAVNGGRMNLETATALLILAVSNHWTPQQLQTEIAALQPF
ncbi:asparaginase [Neisseria montereyensis]|uniref:Asparaginase n=1 Tax=Neisseria montereyensis TaxID=2973938 RepID=A0ABT2FCH5_9NEIS|nr:asparaginase [Neisseria montereyensis]MCS4533645.1 asparaginase [Neisseria montereyensis]